MNQKLTPLAEALKKNAQDGLIPFDVPGHKGRLISLADYFGKECLLLDKNSRPDLDYLGQPRGIIKEAQELAAEAFGAKQAYFMVGGTTSSIQAMVMSACNPGEKIILPRNVHYSVLYALILADAVPIYVNPQVHNTIGISLGMNIKDLKECIHNNPDAKAILINNPTYYGICSDLDEIVKIAHKNNMLVLADEAHGTHFYFGKGFPKAAMRSGADMSAVSMHKTGGSLTQSSILLVSDRVEHLHVMNIINLTRTTSASYLLMASLDIARSFLATKGEEILAKTLEEAKIARDKINAIGGYYAFGPEIINNNTVCDFDQSKISINTLGIGLAGIEVYSLLKDYYHIQLEFGDTGNILALSTISDISSDLDLLVAALRDIKEKYSKPLSIKFKYEYLEPTPVIAPRAAFYAEKELLPINYCENRISGDAVMCYPPGIPILMPGEKITREVIEHIMYAKEKGCSVIGLDDNNIVRVVKTTK